MWRNFETLVKNPWLAHNVRSLMLDFSLLERSEQNYISNHAENLSLLLGAHNVQTLQIADIGDKSARARSSSEYYSWLDVLSWVASGETRVSQTFSHLKHLRISDHTVKLRALAPVFRLPGVKSLELNRVRAHEALTDWIIPESSRGIQELEFSDCSLSLSLVVQIVRCLRSMTTFRYHLRLNRTKVEAGFSWQPIGDALRAHPTSLRTVHLTNYLEDHGSKRTSLGSLKECTKLRELVAPLLSIDALEQGRNTFPVLLRASCWTSTATISWLRTVRTRSGLPRQFCE